jgi:hypothetical protein
MGALFMISIFSIAAIAAAGGDTRGSRYDQDDKQALAAAEAGIADYFFHLDQTPTTGRAAPERRRRHCPCHTRSNQQFTGTPPSGRRWRDVPGSNSRYSIELIPAPGKTACNPADPIGSMIDRDGNLRIRSTGNVKGTANYRAQVATFRAKGFLDFLYFTDLGNQDPIYADVLADEYGLSDAPSPTVGRRSTRGRPTSASATGGAPRRPPGRGVSSCPRGAARSRSTRVTGIRSTGRTR